MRIVIDIENVTKCYRRGDPPAVAGVTLAIGEEERVGLIGANGSGKTTLLRLLLNFIRPDSGRIRIKGENDLEKARKHLGFIPERQQGMENFTPRELLQYAARMRGMPRDSAADRIAELLSFAELDEVSDELLLEFSKGMCQRVQVCLALLHRPEILLLDEPMSGLDPIGQADVRRLLLKLPGITLVYATHHLDEIETFCDKVIVMHRGQLRESLSLRNMEEEIFSITLDAAAKDIMGDFSQFPAHIVTQTSDSITVELKGDSGVFQQFSRALEEKQLIIRRLRSRSVLEDLYRRFVNQ